MDLEAQPSSAGMSCCSTGTKGELAFKCLHATAAVVNTILFFVLTGSATHFFTTHS